MNGTITTTVLAALVMTACGSRSDRAESLAIQKNSLSANADANPSVALVIPGLTSTPTASGSTVPANGDVNPYGVAFVPRSFPPGGLLRGGDVIVSNFNNSANLQGTGTTIVRVNPGASPSLFFSDRRSVWRSSARGKTCALPRSMTARTFSTFGWCGRTPATCGGLWPPHGSHGKCLSYPRGASV
jgi:hypothetical protein